MKKISTEKQRKVNAGAMYLWCTKCHQRLKSDFQTWDNKPHWCWLWP